MKVQSIILDAAMDILPTVGNEDAVQDEGNIAKAIGAAAIIGTGLGAGIPTGSHAAPAVTQSTLASLPSPRNMEVSYQDASQLPKPKALGAWTIDFIEFVKRLENSDRIGWKDGKWYPYKSFEGGMPTIGYGYKIRSDNDLKAMRSGIDNSKAMDLLISELNESWDKVKAFVKTRYGLNPDTLSQKQREMLTEFAFNIGDIGKFPKFVDAVIKNDMKEAAQHYQRSAREATKKIARKGKRPIIKTGKMVPMTRRNDLFYKRFFT